MVHDYIHLARAPHPRKNQELRQERELEKYRRFVPGRTVFSLLATMVAAFVIAGLILIRQSTWNGQDQHTFVMVFGAPTDVSRSLALVTVRGQAHTATVLVLPDDLMLETLHGYGLYKASSLHGLAVLEKLPYTFMTSTLSFQFGMQVQDVVWVDHTVERITPDTLVAVFQQELLFRGKSTVAYLDRYKYWSFFSSIRKDQLSTIDLLSSGFVRRSADEADGQVLDVVKLDQFVSQVLADTTLRKESKTVAIVNTTSETKLATRVARALTNMGVDVVNIAQTSENLEHTQLAYSSERDLSTQTVQTVQRVMGVAKKNLKKNPARAVEARADVVVVLGKDTAALFTR